MNDQEPPKTVKEVGIHLGYMKGDITEIKELLKDMKDGYVPRHEYTTFKDEVNVKFQEMKRRTWVQNTLSAVAGVVLALLTTSWFNK
jgi:hypothetical protein